jgi:hypothetical protein
MIDGCDQTWRTGMTRREGSKRCVWRARARWVPPLPRAFPFGLLPHAAARGGGCRVKGCRWWLKRRKRTNDSHADNANVIVTNPAHQGINIDSRTREHFDPNIKSINPLNATVSVFIISEFVGEVGSGVGKETIESDPCHATIPVHCTSLPQRQVTARMPEMGAQTQWLRVPLVVLLSFLEVIHLNCL